MTSEIRLYVEGGGDQKDTKARLRTAFGAFLKEVRDRAREKRLRWYIITCGGRTSTFDAYQRALQSNPLAFNVLLVDAEAPVSSDSPWEHLKSRPGDEWDNPGMEDEHCHLMVQAMEAWLVADREKLREYYGQSFHENALPKNPNVEQIDKDALIQALKHATRDSTKREYHKTKHAPEILERIRSSEVRPKARFCDRLFRKLIAEIEAA